MLTRLQIDRTEPFAEARLLLPEDAARYIDAAARMDLLT